MIVLSRCESCHERLTTKSSVCQVCGYDPDRGYKMPYEVQVVVDAFYGHAGRRGSRVRS